MTKPETSAEDLLQRWGKMCSDRAPWQTLWTQIADYIMPRKFGGNPATAPGTSREARLFDTTAIHANTVLANGQLSWAHGDGWFTFSPPAKFKKSQAAKRWFQEITEITRDLLANSSNFQTAVHEFYLDRSAFGTASLFVEAGRSRALNFQVFPLGSFAIEEDEEGNIDTVFREFKLTARQAESKFGREALSKKIVQALESKDATERSKSFTFIHCIFPRTPSEINEKTGGPLNMPIASVYVCQDDKAVIDESGYMEMPAMVSRFLEWNSGLGGVYGWSPAWAALPAAKQLNLLQMWMDALAEKAAFPPILKPASMEGEIDLSAGAINEYDDSNPQGAVPREFEQQNRGYDLGLQRIQERQREVERHFFVDLFQMFKDSDGKNITATFVSAKMREQIAQISPSFSRLKNELHGPLLARVFSICLQRGFYPDPPQELVEPIEGTQLGNIPSPLIGYNSRFDLELRQLNSSALEQALLQLQSFGAFDPSVTDNIIFDEPTRDAFANLPTRYTRPVDERDAIRKARQEQQAQAAQMQQAAEMAKAAGSLAKVEPDKVQKLMEVAR
jgi:hypothetical protein